MARSERGAGDASTLESILIVEHDAAARTVLQRLLRSRFHIQLAENAAEAFGCLESGRYDLILLALDLPDDAALRVIKYVRGQIEIQDVPIILLANRDESIAQAVKAGANEVITRPIHKDEALLRVRAQLALRRAISDFKLSQRMQERILRIISHDLKGPLTNLRMAHYLLRDQFGDDPQTQPVLENIDLSLNELQDMIRVFLDAAAAQPGQVETVVNCINALDTMRNVVNQYALLAARKNIRIEYEERSHPVLADHRLLAQMLSNYLSNAIKYSPPGAIVRVWTETDGKVTRFFVADQGPGIPENERDKLFQMFGKLSTRPTGKESSTGLGLWIVKHFATLQEGTVGVENAPEGGSVFWFELPACETQDRGMTPSE